MDKKFKVSRKDFLKLASSFGAMVCLGFIAHKTNDAKVSIRPPGAIEPEDFMALCLKCRKCVEVCPTSVIQTEGLQDGLVSFGTPFLSFDLGYCNFCGMCLDACPTGALSRDKFVQTPVLGVAEIDPDACIAWYWQGCGKCVSACPEGAIFLDDRRRPVVIKEKCNGCGLCEHVCPRSALRSYDISNTKGISVKPI